MKKTVIILSVFALMASGCKQSNTNKQTETATERIDILKSSDFQIPDERVFNERIQKVFGLNVQSISGDFLDLEIQPIVSDEPDIYPTLYIKEKYLDYDDFVDDMSFASFNKYCLVLK